jgi:hypothetical protein
MLLSATGTFSADSGRSIFLEQHLDQRGARKYFRWEIPYPYIYRIEAETDAAAENVARDEPHVDSPPRAAAAATGESSGGTASCSPFLNETRPLD